MRLIATLIVVWVSLVLLQGETVQPDSLLPVRNDVTSKVASLKDSLTKSGVDTILIVVKKCLGCLEPAHPKEQIASQFFYESEPAYVFWCKENRYYIKKIDQFFTYKTIERKFGNHFPIYDFFGQNKTGIIAGDSIAWPTDSVIKNRQVPELYPGGNFDYTYLVLYLNKDSFTVAIDEMKLLPTAGDSPGPNSPKNYSRNFLSVTAEWNRIINNELFLLEVGKQWSEE